MTKVLICGSACFGFLVCAAVGQPPAAEHEGVTIRLDVNLIQLQASVTDRSGQFVSGLHKHNFKLSVDGASQPITTFEHDDAPVAAGILVDNSASMTRKGEEVIAAALAFARESNSEDEMFVVHFSNEAQLGLPSGHSFTGNISELEAALSRFSAEGTTSLYDAVALAISQLQRTSLERKVLLIISDGGDNSSRTTFEDAALLAQKAGVLIYCIGIYDDEDRYQNPQILTRFAEITGGRSYFPSQLNDVTNTCIRIARDIRRQYTLGFEGKTDGKYHQVNVTAYAPESGELRVRTRAGYLAPRS
jgi:Ca-activated chloride channel family protein